MIQVLISLTESAYKEMCENGIEYVDYDIRQMMRDATLLPNGHGRLIDADALEQKLSMLGVSNAYDRPSFWYGKDKKDYKVIPTKYHNGYDNALADVEKAIQELPTIEADKEGAEE